VETIGSKWSYTLTRCMPNNDDDDGEPANLSCNTDCYDTVSLASRKMVRDKLS